MKKNTKEYTKEEVYDAVSVALGALYVLKRQSAGKNWAKMSKFDKIYVGRDLVFIKDFSKRTKKFMESESLEEIPSSARFYVSSFPGCKTYDLAMTSLIYRLKKTFDGKSNLVRIIDDFFDNMNDWQIWTNAIKESENPIKKVWDWGLKKYETIIYSTEELEKIHKENEPVRQILNQAAKRIIENSKKLQKLAKAKGMCKNVQRKMKEYSEKEIYSAISATFEAFYILARKFVKIAWKKMSEERQCDSGRALVFIKNVAANPAEYFLRSKTEKDWKKRADAFVKEWKISSGEALEKAWKFSPADNAFYQVSNPRYLVVSKAQAAFDDTSILFSDFDDFCVYVQNWEYNRTYYEDSPVGILGLGNDVEKILEEAEKIQKKAKATRMYRIMNRRKQRVLKYSREGIIR